MKVRTKLNLILVLVILLVALGSVVSVKNMEDVKDKALETMDASSRQSYDDSIKEQVGVVISLLTEINEEYKAGTYTLDEAKQIAAEEVRQMRYGEAGYFWIDQSDGTNAVSTLAPLAIRRRVCYNSSMSREALVLLVCCCDFRDGAERLIPSKSLRNAVIRAFPGLFRILRMCAPRRAAAVVRPRGREKSADRRRRILISRLLIIRASVPRRKSPFPAYFKGFPAVSPLIPPYPAFLKYPVSPHSG